MKTLDAHIRHNYRRALTHAMHLCRNRDDAEDLVQNTMLRCTQFQHHFDLSRDFWPWCKRIMVNLYIDQYRSRSKLIEIPFTRVYHHESEAEENTNWGIEGYGAPEELIDYQADPFLCLEDDTMRRCVEGLLPCIKPINAEAFVKVVLEGISTSDLAAQLGITRRAAYHRVWCAVLMLRQLIRDQDMMLSEADTPPYP